MNNVGLVIIYNHNYESNIEKIERIYQGRFRKILHLIPFYYGDRKNVVCVNYSSFLFQGYFSEAYARIADMGCEYYLFIADDLVLNTKINEFNVLEFLEIDSNSAGITELKPLTNSDAYSWYWGLRSMLDINVECGSFIKRCSRCEFKKFLPSPNEFMEKFRKYGFPEDNYVSDEFFNAIIANLDKVDLKLNLFRTTISKNIPQIYDKVNSPRKPDSKLYPLLYGFSDIFILPASTMQQFCRYCGIMAAAWVFVETAIPTTLALTAENVLHGKWKHQTLWGNDRNRFSVKTIQGIYDIFKLFPDDIYIHPIKLSKIQDI